MHVETEKIPEGDSPDWCFLPLERDRVEGEGGLRGFYPPYLHFLYSENVFIYRLHS